MSRASRLVELGWLPNALRIGGIVVLLVIQGCCALVAQGLYRLSRSVEYPSREARHAAAVAMGAAPGAFLPSMNGYVDHFEDEAIAIMTVQGLGRVRVDDLTIFRTREGPALASDLHPGTSVGVGGAPDAEGRILADVVVIRPAQ